MNFKDFNDSITVPMDSVNATKNTSWRVFGKYEAMNILHGLVTVARIAAILYLLHFFHVKFWGISF
jgi:hypothetical protein